MFFNMAAIIASGIALIVVACMYYISPYWYLIGFVILNAIHIFFNIFMLTSRPDSKKFIIKYRWYCVYGESIFIMLVSIVCIINVFRLLSDYDSSIDDSDDPTQAATRQYLVKYFLLALFPFVHCLSYVLFVRAMKNYYDQSMGTSKERADLLANRLAEVNKNGARRSMV